MKYEEAAKILDPETTAEALRDMTREESMEAVNDASVLAAKVLREKDARVPDPETGLMPCGCGGKAKLLEDIDISYDYYDEEIKTDMYYQAECQNCHFCSSDRDTEDGQSKHGTGRWVGMVNGMHSRLPMQNCPKCGTEMVWYYTPAYIPYGGWNALKCPQCGYDAGQGALPPSDRTDTLKMERVTVKPMKR